MVNDGANPETRSLISNLVAHPITYLETPRIGLGAARNLGLQAAKGAIASYLDDDNSLTPNFVRDTIDFFKDNPSTSYTMARQRRQRNVVEEGGKLLKRGRAFLSPAPSCQFRDLLVMKELFDSNGFAHISRHAPLWNPDLKVFADYEYLLQCASIWGEDKFQFNPNVLVNYIQTNRGIIGQSNYQQWRQELECIWLRRDKYSIFQSLPPDFLLELIDRYSQKGDASISAFS